MMEWLYRLELRFWSWRLRTKRRFWMWLLALAALHLNREDRISVLEDDWWGIVRHRLRQLRQSDLGVDFIRTLFMEDEWNAPDHQGRDYRDIDRDIRDPK